MGTRIHENQGQSAEKVYAAAEQWVDRALRKNDSLLRQARKSGRAAGWESFANVFWTNPMNRMLRSWTNCNANLQEAHQRPTN